MEWFQRACYSRKHANAAVSAATACNKNEILAEHIELNIQRAKLLTQAVRIS